MDTKELIEKFAEDANISKEKAEIFVKGTFKAITDILIEGDWLEIRDFGRFKVKHDKLISLGAFWLHKGNVKRNKIIKFKFSKFLKDKVKKLKVD